VSTSTGPVGPTSKRGVPIGSPSSRDVYWFFLAPAFCLGFSIWIALALVTGHTVTARVLWCSQNCHVTWVENGQPQYASVDRSRGAIPGSRVSIQTGSVGPTGTVSISASHVAIAIMVMLTIVTTPLAVTLLLATRRARTMAWAAWDRSHPRGYE
jgi:hypothetical protein